MSIVKVLNMLCIWVETCALIYSTRRALWAVTEFKQSSGVFVKPKPQQPVSQAEDVLWCIQVVERLLSWILEQYFTTTLTKFSCYVSVQTGPFRAYNNLDTGQKCKVTFLTRSSYYYVEVQYFITSVPSTFTGWPDSIVYCKLERPWPDCGASPEERGWCEPSGEGETPCACFFSDIKGSLAGTNLPVFQVFL